MRETLRACVDLSKLSWRTSPGKFLLALLLLVAQSVALPLAAPALGILTDAALDGDTRRASIAAAVVAVLALAALTAAHFAHIAYFELGELNFLEMDAELVELSNGSPSLAHHERPDYADRIQVVRQELERVAWTSMQALLSSASLGIAILITAVLLARLNPWLLLLPVAAVPPLLAGRRAEATLAAARTEAAPARRLGAHLFKLATDAGPAKELRVSGVAGELSERYTRSWEQARAVQLRAETKAAFWRIGGQAFFAAAYVSATLLVVRDAVAGQRSVGDVVLVLTLASQVNQQVVGAVTLLQELQRLAQTLANFRWVRQMVAAQTVQEPDVEVPATISDGIRLRSVSFRYPETERDVLGAVDLFLPAGSSVALVGENGAGKTTLVKLLCRFYETTGGVIEIDGVDLRRFPLRAWRDRIASGFQDFARFEFLARETVGIGDLPRAESDDAVLAAVERARAEVVVSRLEQGLDTPLGLSLDGTQLSGGQWQKLALGRAMMREEPLLIVLDEPTSALDAQAEHELFEQYAAGAKRVAERTGAVTLLVSHRFSTVRMADLILVVSGGEIVEAGPHDALIALDGLYAQLYNLQAAQYA